MRFEYLISEKGKRVPGTERMVRNCQRPKGRLSLSLAQEPLCSGQEASSKEWALGAEQGGLTPGDGANHTQAWGCSTRRALHEHFHTMQRPKLGPATSGSLISNISWHRSFKGKLGSCRNLPAFAAWYAAFSLRKCELTSPWHPCHLQVSGAVHSLYTVHCGQRFVLPKCTHLVCTGCSHEQRPG